MCCIIYRFTESPIIDRIWRGTESLVYLPAMLTSCGIIRLLNLQVPGLGHIPHIIKSMSSSNDGVIKSAVQVIHILSGNEVRLTILSINIQTVFPSLTMKPDQGYVEQLWQKIFLCRLSAPDSIAAFVF